MQKLHILSLLHFHLKIFRKEVAAVLSSTSGWNEVVAQLEALEEFVLADQFFFEVSHVTEQKSHRLVDVDICIYVLNKQ